MISQAGAADYLDRIIGVHRAANASDVDGFISNMKRATPHHSAHIFKGNAFLSRVSSMTSAPKTKKMLDLYSNSRLVRGVTSAISAAEPYTVGFANDVNRYLRSTGRGYAGQFTTTGSVLSKMPLRSLGKSYLAGTGLMMLFETAAFGKPANLDTLADVAWNNVPFTLSMELAGMSKMGMVKSLGWQVGGEMLGLGPWGSLGLQVAGSIYLPGLAPLAVGVGAAYAAGKGVYNLGKQMYELGRKANKTTWQTGDMSYATSEAATMRQRSLGAIQNSGLNMRQLLGNEARMLMGR